MENIFDNVEKTPTVYVLVGLPCTGKSTWARRALEQNPVEYISRDQFIDEYAKEHGITYHSAFGKIDQKRVDSDYYKNIKKIIAKDKSVIVDKTHLNRKSRKNTLRLFPNYYRKVAIVFDIDESKRIEYEKKRSEKQIPQNIIDSMKKSFNISNINDEFDNVYNFNTEATE